MRGRFRRICNSRSGNHQFALRPVKKNATVGAYHHNSKAQSQNLGRKKVRIPFK